MKSKEIIEMIRDEMKDLFHSILLQQERTICLKELLRRIENDKAKKEDDIL